MAICNFLELQEKVHKTEHEDKKYVTARCYRSLNTLTEVEEPAGMGDSLGTGAHRHRSISPPGVKYVPGPWVLRRIMSNRSQSLIAYSNGHLSDSLKTTA